MRRALAVLACLVAAAPAAAFDPDAVLDRLGERLTLSTADGRFRAAVSGLADLEGWYVDQRPPGIVFGDGASFANPRLTLFLDAHAGRRLYAFVQARVDRGFDPREVHGAEARADEYLVRWSPLGPTRLHLQVGKFATAIGNWVGRHLSWDNPLVTAPLPYERITGVTDGVAPNSTEELVARRDLPDNKPAWVPIIWGPNYAAGASAFGRIDRVDWALEVKNAAPASRPYEWNPVDRGWREPTVTGHLGWSPSAAWALGLSASSGPYLREATQLAQGQRTRDFRQILAGADARWAWRKLELWSELYFSRFEVPILNAVSRRPATSIDADVMAWYVEGRWKLPHGVWLALRWNQEWFAKVQPSRGEEVAWDRDTWRMDTGIGWRAGRYFQAKLQYAFNHQNGPLQQGEQLVVAQLTLRF
ncbi:MAG: hypothetical protein KIT14_12700 [bacterium]|nr:hypothetical protein [bacterium]